MMVSHKNKRDVRDFVMGDGDKGYTHEFKQALVKVNAKRKINPDFKKGVDFTEGVKRSIELYNNAATDVLNMLGVDKHRIKGDRGIGSP